MGITKLEALKAIDRDRELFCKTSDLIWDNPETAFLEHKSMEILCDLLEKEGFEVKKNIANIPTAFTGTFGHGKPIIGFLGEFDALSGLSQVAGCAERKELVLGAAGHGCGHNLLGVGSVAAAVAMKEYLEKNEKEGTVVFFGCPGEEGGSGKAFMAREGVFDDVDFAISWHPQATNEVWVGSTLANYQISYRFHGISSHAAGSPEKGRSALDALMIAFQGIEFMREHVPEDVKMHYTLTELPGPANVVHVRSSAKIYLRSFHKKNLDDLTQRFENVIKGAALITDTTYEISREKQLFNKIPVLLLNQLLMENAELAGPPQLAPPRERTGSTDFGNVMYHIPGSCIRVAFVPAGTSSHSQEFVDAGKTQSAHDCIIYAAKSIAGAAWDLISTDGLMEQVKEEFAENKKKYC